MDFRRKKQRGVNQKTRRIWLSPEGYRIIWRSEVSSITVPARFQACVRTIIPWESEEGTRVVWDFVSHSKPLHRTIKAAVCECEKHHRLWTKATECTGIRALCELLGYWPFGMPEWVANQLYHRVFATLLDTSLRRKSQEKEEEEENDTPTAEMGAKLTQGDKSKSQKKPNAAAPKKRKPRSDRGKKRGPRKPKGTT